MSARHSLQTFLCGLGGHELMRSFEPDRVCLRCTSCPYETPRVDVEEKDISRRRRVLRSMRH